MIVEIENLTINYDGILALDNVSLSVAEKDFLGIIGPNGAGKTTTIKMLTTLLEPTSGTMKLNGFDPAHNQAAVRSSFGIVFQDPSLDDELTAEENLELHGVLYAVPKELRRKRMSQLLEIVGLTDRKNDLVKHFSGGMKRRLEIARGLLHHPKILFLDEPTIGLDPQTRNHLWSYVQDLNKSEGITVFLTTHYMEEADKVASRIAVIDHGTIIAVGTSQELKNQTKTNSLEDAFLALPGDAIREEEASSVDRMRSMGRAWGRR